MSTDTPTRRRRPSMLFEVSSDMLLPRDLGNVPEPIVEANEHAWRQYDAYLAARGDLGTAQHAATAAPRHDQYALEAALAADEKPPKATAPAKQQRAEDAQQRVEAAEKLA